MKYFLLVCFVASTYAQTCEYRTELAAFEGPLKNLDKSIRQCMDKAELAAENITDAEPVIAGVTDQWIKIHETLKSCKCDETTVTSTTLLPVDCSEENFKNLYTNTLKLSEPLEQLEENGLQKCGRLNAAIKFLKKKEKKCGPTQATDL